MDPEENQGEHPLDYLTAMWILGAEVGRDSEPLSLIRSGKHRSGLAGFVCDFDLSNGLSMMILLLRREWIPNGWGAGGCWDDYY